MAAHPRTDGLGRLEPVASRALAISLVFLGLLHLIFGEMLTRWVPDWAGNPPGQAWWARGLGIALAVAAAGLLVRRPTPGRALCAAVVLLIPVLALHVPRAWPTGEIGSAWLGVFKWSAMAVAPLLLVPPRIAGEGRQVRTVNTGITLAPWLLAVFMLVSAILHVRHDEFVAQLMQPWMPWRMFWTYLAAVALAAGAVGLTVPVTRRRAALLTSLMILLWFFIVHVPRMLNDPTGPVGWSEMAESLAFSAMALLLAARFRRVPERLPSSA